MRGGGWRAAAGGGGGGSEVEAGGGITHPAPCTQNPACMQPTPPCTPHPPVGGRIQALALAQLPGQLPQHHSRIATHSQLQGQGSAPW